MSVPRPEYPRPQFVREAWLNLNGPWDFSFDEPGFDRTITVPFAYQAALSGIGTDERHDRVWYRRAFALPEDWAGKRVLLHFGAVDYTCKVWVNGALAGGHTGGHAGFSLDVTEALRPGENVLTVLAEDDHADREMPRGKQYWGEKPRSIFYTPTSGIWLIPTTVASVRQAAGCAAPFDILPAVWLASALSVTVGVLAAKIFAKFWR